MERLNLAIIVPAYNEEKTISRVVEKLIPYGRPIVIDDGSSDSTSIRASKAGALVITHSKNLGYDEALNTGFKEAFLMNYSVALTFDADGQHDESLIPKFLQKINNGDDVVVGIRNKKQRFAEYVFGWYTNLRFNIKDPLCGMKAYKKNIYELLGHFDSYGSTGTELMLFAAKNRFSIGEVVVNIREREDEPRFGTNFTGDYKVMKAMLLSLW